MSILILGSDGFIGKNLKYFFIERNLTFLEFDRKNTSDLSKKIKKSKFIIHLADKIKSKNKNDFKKSKNFTERVITEIKKSKERKYLIYTSSKNINTKNNPHYELKRQTEKILKANKHLNTFILRLPNIFGKWCKPNYNSFFTTACYNLANQKNLKITSENKITLLHVSDLCEYILRIIKTKKINNNFIEKKFIYLKPRELKNILLSIKNKKDLNSLKKYNLTNNQINKIYSTYLFYDSKNVLVTKFKKIKDARGDFAELIKNDTFGQISLLSVLPGKERGNHFHDHKIEKFFIISGKGKLVHENVINKKIKSFVLSEDSDKFYTTIPGWSHKIKNTTKKKLIILIWANEVYDKNLPDTIKWPIK